MTWLCFKITRQTFYSFITSAMSCWFASGTTYVGLLVWTLLSNHSKTIKCFNLFKFLYLATRMYCLNINQIVHTAKSCQDVCLHTINKPPNMEIQLTLPSTCCIKKLKIFSGCSVQGGWDRRSLHFSGHVTIVILMFIAFLELSSQSLSFLAT